MHNKNSGFTLIEIAIVLVIIGLLLGGVLKGQELINNAKVRNIISQQDSYKAAFFAFQDRFRALPGDYLQAAANIPGNPATPNGDGNSRVEEANAAACNESVIAWLQLARAGFISGNFNSACNSAANAGTVPTNAYGGIVQLVFDANFNGVQPPLTHNLKTGRLIPVTIISEIDRKLDDGFPDSGIFRFSGWQGAAANCVVAGVPPAWNIAGAAADCGGAYLF